MSIKSLIQIIILFFIAFIIGSVYFKYFDTKKNLVDEVSLIELNNKNKLNELEKKLLDLELKNETLNQRLKNKDNTLDYSLSDNNEKKIEKISDIKSTNVKEKKKENNVVLKKKTSSEQELKNLVKDVEYTSIDQKGNKFYLLATSGKSNINNNDILDLKNVRGRITSDIRDTIYIISDFAEYNSINLNSKFYENVVINFQDKEINCVNFDINMETNKAIAYNEVIITDPKSVIKAGIVEFDLKTKNIDIKPESALAEIKVETN